MNHPLFPNAPEDDKREIAWVHVTRFERTGQIWFPRAFKAEELQGLDDIAGMFGGGTYELIGRAASTKSGGVGVIIDRIRVTLPGEPLPFVQEETAGAPAPAPMPFQVPQGGNDMHAIVIAMMQMQQASQAQQTQLMATMFQASSQQTAAIVTAMAAGRSEGNGSAEMIRAMGEMQKSHTEAMAALYTATRGSGGGGGGGGGDATPMDALMQGLELGQAMGEKGAQEPSDLAIVMQGVTAALQAPRPANAPPAMNANGTSSS